MNRLKSSNTFLIKELEVCNNKTSMNNSGRTIKGMSLNDLFKTTQQQLESIEIKLSIANYIHPIINKIDFQNNSLRNNSQTLIPLSNAIREFDIQLRISEGNSHRVLTYWLVDTYLSAIVSSVEICSIIVGNLFVLTGENQHSIRDQLNSSAPGIKISKLFRRHIQDKDNAINYLQTARNMWNKTKHSGLQNIIDVRTDALCGVTPARAYIQEDLTKLPMEERRIDIFSGKLLEEGIVFISSINDYLGYRLKRELLPLILIP